MLQVKIESGLSISVLRNKETLYKNLGFKTDEFQKGKVYEIFSIVHQI
jgi:hypothetical protein